MRKNPYYEEKFEKSVDKKFDRVLEVFVQVVVLEDGSGHLLLAVVYRDDRQGVEGWLLGLAPQYVAMFQSPVAERNDDIVKLQTLALVDRENADAIY